MNRPFSNFLVPVVAAGALLSWFGEPAQAQTIPKGDIVVDLETFAALPNSGSNEPARANVLRSAPDGSIFVNDQRGILYRISADGTTVTPFLDLTKYVPLLADDAERGFQSFAFHPDFEHPGKKGYGKFYTMASQSDTSAIATFDPGIPGVKRDHDEVLLEWKMADPNAEQFVPADTAQPFREVLRIARPNSNHNAGYLSFNPTAGEGPDRNNLYIGTGDSGGGGDPLGLAQSLDKVYGAILRINPLLPAENNIWRSANGQYSVPSDNPAYINNPYFLVEKYVGGFRNPQRFTWDSANGRMFIADIGQNSVEEIDVGEPGSNYGWNLREGSYVFEDGGIGDNVRNDSAETGFTYPIAEYFHYSSIGNAVTTGPAYRGTTLPALNGRLIFSDFVNGVPYTLDADNLPDGGQEGITELRVRSNGVELSFLRLIQQVNPAATRADLRFGTDAADNVYLLDKQDGLIRRIVAQPPATQVVVGVGTATPTVYRGGGYGTVIFSRTGDLSAPLSVSYRIGGTLVNERDYTFLTGTETIARGHSTATLVIEPVPGAGDGFLNITLRPGGAYTLDQTAKKVRLQIAD